MKDKRQIMRQGDVLLVPIEINPILYPAATPNNRVRPDGSAILAFGEATGHAHVANAPGVELLMGGSRQWASNEFEVLAVNKATTVTHEEHAPLSLDKGLWQVIHQREYSPEATRRVFD